MKSQLYIPKKLKVGFQNRSDTYTKKLAYVTYIDDKGVHRKQTSWDGWRDKKIEPMDVDNVPTSGFILNKDVHRGGYEWFGVGRNHIRIYDSRGIEFEITPENLIFILMNTNCFKRELEGEFVYSWDGKDLVLLPANCEEYKQSSGFSDLQGKKVLAKTLVPGYSYTSKKEEVLVYIGRYNWYTVENDRKTNENYNINKTLCRKKYVFMTSGNKPRVLSDVSSLANLNSDTIADNYAELVELLQEKYINVSKVVAIEAIPYTKEIEVNDYGYGGLKLYQKLADNSYQEYSFYKDSGATPGEIISLDETGVTGSTPVTRHSYGYSRWSYNNVPSTKVAYKPDGSFYTLDFILENGKKFKQYNPYFWNA